LAGAVLAQQLGGFDGSGDPSGSGGTPGSVFTNFGGEGSFAQAARTRATHGILASVTMVVLFPLGAVMVRFLPAGRIALWTHGLIQMAAVCALVATAALGYGVITTLNEMEGSPILLVRSPPPTRLTG
jgi:hypothetical protein